MSQVEISGIVKIPQQSVVIGPTSFVHADKLANALNLLPLASEKLHVTLLHQSVSGLKALDKQVKKFSKGKIEEDPALYPSTSLPEINTEGGQVVLVKDTHPKTDEERLTVRIILRDELQQALSTWVAEFCELNSLERDEVEMQRVYHISYANRTGNPGDSVR